MPTRTVQAWIPPERLEDVASLDEVVRVRPPAPPVARRGSTLSEGATVVGAAALHAQGIDGRGIKIGVISDGIAGHTISQDSGDLPAITAHSVTASGDAEGGWGGPDPGSEGTAMLEIIHDIAPGAELFFSNHDTSLAMAQSIQILAQTYDCDIVIDDIGWFDQPFFEDGVIANAAKAVVDSGKVFCSAFGNDADQHYQGMFVNSGESYDDALAHDFGDGDTTIDYTLEPGDQLYVALNWNTPFETAAVDMDMLLFDASGTIVASAAATQKCPPDEPSGIAYEALEYTNDSSETAVYSLRVLLFCPEDVTPEFELFSSGPSPEDHNVAADSSFGHPTVVGVIGCAAMDAFVAPEGEVEFFSSRGPSTLYGGPVLSTGLLSGRVERAKPDVTGVDGVAVTGNGGFGSPFFGTSAAAPHVGACAALVMQAHPEWTGAQVRAALLESAIDVGAPGFDAESGAGVVDPAAAIALDFPSGGGTVTEEPENSAPIAVGDDLVTDEDTPVAIDVLENDNDPDGDDFALVGFTSPANGELMEGDDGGLTYLPDEDYFGLDTFTYTIEDTEGQSAMATVTVTVISVNDIPVAGDDTAITPEDETVTVAVVDNDSDADGDSLVVISADPPSHGTVTINAGVSISYKPVKGYNGPDSFTYTVSDQRGGTATAEVAVTVIPVYKSLDDDKGGGGGAPSACGMGVISIPVVLMNIFGLTALQSRRRSRRR
jgi:hypothetical protein